MKTFCFISILFLLALSPAAARACQCIEPTLESSLAVAAEADLIVSGAVTAVRYFPKLPSNEYGIHSYAEADVAVDTVIKGDNGVKTATFRFHPESMPLGDGVSVASSCGLSYREGQSDRFVLRRDAEGIYHHAGFCAIIIDEAWEKLLAERG